MQNMWTDNSSTAYSSAEAVKQERIFMIYCCYISKGYKVNNVITHIEFPFKSQTNCYWWFAFYHKWWQWRWLCQIYSPAVLIYATQNPTRTRPGTRTFNHYPTRTRPEVKKCYPSGPGVDAPYIWALGGVLRLGEVIRAMPERKHSFFQEVFSYQNYQNHQIR